MATPLVIQLAVAKVLVLTMLLTAGLWIGRVFRANRHNYVVNRHRQNALKTFEVFVNSSPTPEIKSAVLLQTTTCIFTPQNSGYIGGEAEGPSPSFAVEAFRALTEGSKHT